MGLSIIIVEYHCLEELKRCVTSIKEKIQNLNYEILISSNSIYDKGLREKLYKEFPGAKWLFNMKNLGFAKAVNIGIKTSKGKYLLILNPDAYLIDRNVHQLLQYFEDNPDVGVIGPKIINIEGKIQDSYRSFMTPYIFISRVTKKFKYKIKDELLESKNHNTIKTVDWISGGCMFIKRKAIEKVGLMDEKYFMYIEDMDWCKRFWDNGFKVIYWPYLAVCHNPSRHSSAALSRRKLNKLMLIHFFSYLKFFWKFFPESICLKNKHC